MELTVSLPALREALNLAKPALADRTALAVLANFLLDATEDGALSISANNLVFGIRTSVPAKVHTPGAVTIDAGMFRDFVATLNGEQVRLSVDMTRYRMTVTSGKDMARISGTSEEDFPRVRAEPGNHQVTLDAADVRTAVRVMPFAAAADQTRPVLCGVGLDIREREIAWGSSDGYRMSSLKTDADCAGPFKVVIPAAALRALGPIVADAEGPVTFDLSPTGGQFAATIGDAVWTSSIITGTMPNVEQIVPKEFRTTIEVSCDSTIRALRRAGIFVRGDARLIRLSITPGEDDLTPASLVVMGNSGGSADMRSEIAGTATGYPLDIGIDRRFLVDFLGEAKSETFVLRGNGENQAMVFTDPALPAYHHVAMPMSIKDS